MGLKADIEEVTANWDKAPWWLRTWLLLSAFIAISSIASLAETITKWKGFFKSAMSFYRDWIREPVASLLHGFGIHMHPLRVDMYIFGLLIGMSLARYFFLEGGKSRSGKRWAIGCAAVMLGSLCINMYLHNNDPKPPSLLRTVVQFSAALALPGVLKMRMAWVFYAQVAFVLFVVALMAAINSGLSA